jgi:F-type H+-transporting ATPase subunit a
MEEAINAKAYCTVTVGGAEVPFVTDAVIAMWVVMALIAAAVLVLTRGLTAGAPGRRQAAAEIVVGFFDRFARAQAGPRGARYAVYFATILIFIGASNVIAVFNVVPSGGALAALFGDPALASFSFELHPPTKNINVTACLAVVSILAVLTAEFRFKGVRGWLRSFVTPSPISIFTKLLDYVVRPLSLCLRLFGNMLGGLIVMTLVYSAFPVFFPAVAGIYFDLFDGGLQAYVFVFLTSIYLSEATEAPEGAEAAEAVAAPREGGGRGPAGRYGRPKGVGGGARAGEGGGGEAQGGQGAKDAPMPA